MSKKVKASVICLVIWLGIQAVAWFYGGKDTAGLVALLGGVFLGGVMAHIISDGEWGL